MQFRSRTRATDPDGAADRNRHRLFGQMIVSDRYWPVRGLLYSFLSHEVTIFALIFVSIFSIMQRTRLAERAAMIERNQLREVIFLPVLGGGDPEPGLAEGEAGDGDEELAAATDPGTEGLSYPGPQPMVSEFPVPTNEIQTLLQPALENPPTVEPSQSLPNIVQMADAGPAPFVQFSLPDPDSQLILPASLLEKPPLEATPLDLLAEAIAPPVARPEIRPELPEIPELPPAPPEAAAELALPDRLFGNVAELAPQAPPSKLPELDPQLEAIAPPDASLEKPAIETPELTPFQNAVRFAEAAPPSALPQVDPRLEAMEPPGTELRPPQVDAPLLAPTRPFAPAAELSPQAPPSMRPTVDARLGPLESALSVAPIETPTRIDAPELVLPVTGFSKVAELEGASGPATLPDVEPELEQITATRPERPAVRAVPTAAATAARTSLFENAAGLTTAAAPAMRPEIQPELEGFEPTRTDIPRRSLAPIDAPGQALDRPAFQSAGRLEGQSAPRSLPAVELTALAALDAPAPGRPRSSIGAEISIPRTPQALESSTRVRPPRRPPTLTDFPSERLAPLATSGTDGENLLVLTPMPALPEPSFEIAAGEARGEFAISPDANMNPSDTDAGSRTDTPPSDEVREQRRARGSQGLIGMLNQIQAENATTKQAAGDAGPGTPGRGGDGPPGARPDAAPGPGFGSSSGGGTGGGEDTFPGISILEGGSQTGMSAGRNPAEGGADQEDGPEESQQRSYGVTVISTEEGGGGLPDFGLFANEQVYTVFLDMRQSPRDTAPPWTVEYAVPRGTSVQTTVVPDPQGIPQGLLLPFPLVKNQPPFPPDLVRRFGRQMVIVYGVVNTDGKLEELSVKDSPHILLNGPVLDTLRGWSFRPAELNGRGARVKVLLGIPLWAAPE